MGIFRQFPYSNFHEMNMDEIIKIVKDLADDWAEYNRKWGQLYDDTAAALQDFIDYYTNYFATLDLQDEVNNRIDAMLESGEFQAIVNSYLQPFIEEFTTHIHRKVIIIGDSYSTGTGGGQSIETPVPSIAKIMNISQSSIYNYSDGGAGFIRNSEDNDPSFERNLDNAIANITNKNEISDICVIGGANDATASNSVLDTNMNRFVAKAHQAFPYAKLWLFAIGWSLDSNDRRNLMNAYRYYANNGNFTYVKLYHLLQDKQKMFNVWHPNEEGVITVARAIGSCLMGGNYGIEMTDPYTEYFYFGTSETQVPVTTWVDTSNVYVQFSGIPSVSGSRKNISYDGVQLGVAYMTHIFGFTNLEDLSHADKTVEILAMDGNDDSWRNGDIKLRFMRRGDGLTDKVIDVYARTFHTESGALANIPVTRFYISPDVITIPIWQA